MAETSSLLRNHTGYRIAGSNPALSAIQKGPRLGPFFYGGQGALDEIPRSSEQSDALRSNAALGGGPEGVSNAEKVLRIIPPSPPYKKGPDRGPFLWRTGSPG